MREAFSERIGGSMSWILRSASNGTSVVQTNPTGLRGGIAEALRGADVCVAFSAGGIIKPEWVKGMAQGCHRIRLRQSRSGDLALGRERGRRANRGDRPQRFPQPGE
jgi:hypothetical protein